MKLVEVLNSRYAILFGLGFSRMVPTVMGYRVARWLADRFSARKNSPMVRAVRANQWVSQGERLTSRQLDRSVRETYRNTGRSLYEFWHFFKDPNIVCDMVEFDPSFQTRFDEARKKKEGTILVVPHISNFDLMGHAVVHRGLAIHILSYPQPSGGYRWQNALREVPGLTVTPMSIDALRQASQTLREGGTVLTGIDRPLPDNDSKYRSRFFGRLASLPVFHIRLALKHNIPITVLGGCRKENGRYCLWASDPIPMQKDADLLQETVGNAETILSVIASYIRRAPDQWAMYYPVWPEALEQMP
jgi:phosphatidylinositol dimannoside acyltransferase